jgi:hypothetical protein
MSTQFTKTAVGAGLIGAPLLTLVASIASPAIKSDDAAQLAVIAAHPARFYAFAIFTWAGIMLFVPALLGLMQMTRDRAAGLGNAGGSLALLGALIAGGDAASELVAWQMAAPGADRAQMVALLHRSDSALGSSLVYTVGGLAFLVGLLLLSAGLRRARAVPTWVAIALPLGAFLNIAGLSGASTGILIVSSVILLVAMGWVGWRVLAVPSGRSLVPDPEGAI